MKDLSLHLMDIAMNSIKAGAALIKISMIYQDGMLLFAVADDGSGMDQEILQKVTDPFTTTRTTRKVGMGIPLLKLSAEMTGGGLAIRSEKGRGTLLEARFVVNHIDRIPAGEIDETMKALILANPGLDYEIQFQNGQREYELKTIDVKNYMKGVPLQNHEIIAWIGKNIREGMNEVFGGVLNEISG